MKRVVVLGLALMIILAVVRWGREWWAYMDDWYNEWQYRPHGVQIR